MNIDDQISTLRSLAAIDEELRTLESDLEGQRSNLTTKQQQLQDLEEKLRRTKTSIEQMDRTRGELLQELRQMSVQLERSREKLARCRTEREANAAQRELEELRKLYRDREIEIGKLQEIAEQAHQDVASVSEQRDKLKEELGQTSGDVATRLGALEGRLGDARSRRQELVGALPKALYRRYDVIRKRLGSALAFTRDGTCSACHVSMPPMQFQKLRRMEALDQCPNCRRIIYFDPTPPEAASSDDGGEADGATTS